MTVLSRNATTHRGRAFRGLAALLTFIVMYVAMAPSSFSAEMIREEDARPLTLRDSIQTALLNNRSIQIQEQDVEYAKANILAAQGLFLPQVAVGYAYTHNDAIFNSPALSATSTRKDTGIFQGHKNDNYLNFTLTESIYNGGANIANLEQSKLDLKVQQETLRATKLEIEFETKRLFYGLLLAYETRRIAGDLVDQARAHYDEVKARYEQGTASKFDVLQSKVQVSRLIPQLVSADNAIELIMAELKKVLVINMRQQIKAQGKLAYTLIEIKEEEFLQEAYRRKPEMILKLLGIDVKKWAIEFAKSGWYPDISAVAGYSYRSNDLGDMVNPRHDNWNIGVRATFSIFDGFATKAKVDEAKARYNQARLEKDDVVDQIAVDVRSACLDLIKAKAVIDSQLDSIAEAKEALRLAEVRYVNGVGINLDVFDAQVGLAQVEQNLAQGIYDYVMAKAQLDRTMGHEFFAAEGLPAAGAKEEDHGRTG